MINSSRQFQNFCEYQFKGNYNILCNFPNPTSRTSLNNNIPRQVQISFFTPKAWFNKQ
ncbi:MAG: hypothetical protein ACTSXY_12455 [Promethearchaeota archaeon]